MDWFICFLHLDKQSSIAVERFCSESGVLHSGCSPTSNLKICGKENPADCATRGLIPAQLSEHSLWITGPHWLRQSHSEWPSESQISVNQHHPEERSPQVSVVTSSALIDPLNLLHKYSNLSRLLRIIFWCLRAVKRFKNSASPLSGPIIMQELENAKVYWIKLIQQSFFQKELFTVSQGQPLARSNPLLRLTPIMDSNGILRIGGRLQSSSLPSTAQHPIILPRGSTFTTLVVGNAHQRTMYGGTRLTLTVLRNEYWIIGGRAPVRSFILKCVRCTRFRQRRAQQLMGQLPTERTTPSRPFLNSGVDYAGPFLLKTWKGKNSRSYKAYIVLFVCHATSAVHLELVTDYTSESFIAAYKRFTARRGICATLRSDCGTNLKGADSEVRDSVILFEGIGTLSCTFGSGWHSVALQSTCCASLWGKMGGGS